MASSHLNSAQTRVQAMKDELKNTETAHLDSLLEGLSDPEPPYYRKINGRIEPGLEQITLKERAVKYCIGNVVMASDGRLVAITLVAEMGVIEVDGGVPLAKDPANRLTIPIPDDVVLDLLPLFEAKYATLKARLNHLNDLRAFAYHAPDQPVPSYARGKNLTKLLNNHDEINDENGTGTPPRSRTAVEPVQRVAVNKRKHVNIESIPNFVKSEAFSAIPDFEQLKIAVFDSIAKKACPDFGNLRTAAWNVVSLYEVVGSEYVSLHKAMVELKNVLCEIDLTYKNDRKRARTLVTDSTKADQRAKSERARTTSAARATPQRDQIAIHEMTRAESMGKRAKPENNRRPEQISDSNYIVLDGSQDAVVKTIEMPDTPPKSPCSISRPSAPSAAKVRGNGKLVTDNSHGFQASQAHSNAPHLREAQPTGMSEEQKKQVTRHQIATRQRQIQQLHTECSPPAHSDPSPKQHQDPHKRQHSARSPQDMRTPSQIRNTNQTRIDQNSAQSRADTDEDSLFVSDTQTTSPRPKHFLGHSMLDPRKNNSSNTGSAPEAPMLHTIRKDGSVSGPRAG